MWLDGDQAISLRNPKYQYEVVFARNHCFSREETCDIYWPRSSHKPATTLHARRRHNSVFYRLLVTLTSNPDSAYPPSTVLRSIHGSADGSRSLRLLYTLFIILLNQLHHPSTQSSRDWPLTSANALIPVLLDLVGINVNVYIRSLTIKLVNSP